MQSDTFGHAAQSLDPYQVGFCGEDQFTKVDTPPTLKGGCIERLYDQQVYGWCCWPKFYCGDLDQRGICSDGPYARWLIKVVGLLQADNEFGGAITTADVLIASPKMFATALGKIDGSRDGTPKSVASLVDVTRASIVSSAAEYTAMVVKVGNILAQKEFQLDGESPTKMVVEIVRFKNRACGRADTAGYVDMNINLKLSMPVCADGPKSHIAELQLHFVEMLAAKSGSADQIRTLMAGTFGVPKDRFPVDFNGHKCKCIYRTHWFNKLTFFFF